MADDLSHFIEQQKNKLEKERSELTRDVNYNSTGQEIQERKRETPKGNELENINVDRQTPKSSNTSSDETGLQLGGYAKHQQKLREERKQEYVKFLAEKQVRTTGKADPSVLKEKDISPVSNSQTQDNGWRSSEWIYDKNARDSPPTRSRRHGKENLDAVDNYKDDRGYPVKDSYADLLRRKRADERIYRGSGLEGTDIDDELRQMKLVSRNYKFNSRSDGVLARRYDEDEDDEVGYGRRSRRRNKNIESKRVRFHDDDDDDMIDSSWSRPRRRLVNDDDDDDDLYDTIDKLQRQSRRDRRRNSAHEERTINHPPIAEDSVRRTKTENELRSNSAPLLEGTGIIGGSHVETREMKLKKQDKYKKELEKQMKLREENKKKEKMERLGETPGGFDTNHQHHLATRASEQPVPKHAPHNISPGNYGSRPPQHPSLYPSPYDDPYYSYNYGTQEPGERTATALQEPLFKGSGTPGLFDTDYSKEQDHQERRRKIDFAPAQGPPRQSPTGDHIHQPPGGYSNIGGVGVTSIGQVSPDADSIQKKRAVQQAYQEELNKQVELRNKQKKKEKQEIERYDRRLEEEMAKYDPWGKGGAGAPLRDVATGQVIADLRGMHHDSNTDDRKSVNLEINPSAAVDVSSPRPDYQTPQPPRNYQPSGYEPSSYQSPASVPQQGNAGSNSSPYGRSDPLKERQPHDDLKEKAKHDYQHFLKLQVEEKERQKKEELDKIKAEEEKEERRLQEQRDKMQREYLEEQEKMKKKEEELKKQNEAIVEAQNAKKQEAVRKKRAMEDKRQEELHKKLEEEMATKKYAGAANFRGNSPPIPTMRKQVDNITASDRRNMNSQPVPALANQQQQDSSLPSAKPSSPALSTVTSRLPSGGPSRSQAENDVLSQLTALRQQLKHEEQKVQSQIGRPAAMNKYSQMNRTENESRRSKRDVSVFDRALTNKPAGTVRKAEPDPYSAADEFNRIKQEETSSLAGEFRSRFPQPATSDSMLDLQQQEYLREQEDKISSLRAGINRTKHPSNIAGPSRSKSKDSLLESDSEFIAVDEPSQVMPSSQIDLQQPRQTSARERRRWKQLEEMAKEPKLYDAYKPPTPGGFSLNSVTSFNVDEVTSKNEERLKRLEAIQRAGGGTKINPDDVLKQFMSERRRPRTQSSEASLEAETSYEPVHY